VSSPILGSLQFSLSVVRLLQYIRALVQFRVVGAFADQTNGITYVPTSGSFSGPNTVPVATVSIEGITTLPIIPMIGVSLIMVDEDIVGI